MPSDVETIAEVLLDVGRGKLSLKDILGLHPQAFDKLVDRAVAQLQHGQVEEGDRALSDLSHVDAHNPALPLTLGAWRAKRGDHEGAIEAYDEGEHRAERAEHEVLATRIRVSRAQSLLALGRVGAARADLERVAEGPVETLRNIASVGLAKITEGAER